MGREKDETRAALDRLFVTSPREFVATRAALVAALKAKGEPEVAKSVAAARRPPPSAWALNVVAREHEEDLVAYVEAAARLRDAQREAIRRDAVDEFAAARREASERESHVLARAKEVMLGAGLVWTPEAKRRIGANLRAAVLATDEDRARLLAGHLQADLDSSDDFGALAASLGDVKRPSTKAPHVAPHQKEPTAPEPTARPRGAELDAREERAKARAMKARADAEARAAKAAQAKAEVHARKLDTDARVLEGEARELERAAAQAEDRAAKARADATEAQVAAKKARAAAQVAAREAGIAGFIK